MVFGFGFSKEKVLASAEKNVKQGKLQHAINDYERALKEDPKDLTVMNTVGDLYARIGNGEKATEYFRKLGDLYSKDGFTVRAIAMYKKLTKQDPSAIDVITKLAELYTQQGLNNDARAQYMQVAEHHLRNNDLATAAAVFRKILDLDPENLGLQVRLAELLQRMDRRGEARDLYFRTADSLKGRGALEQADDILGKLLNIDSSFAPAILLRGQVKLASGDAKSAIHLLTQMPDLDSHEDALKTVLQAQLSLGNLGEAEPTARKLLQVFNDASGATDFADALMAKGAYEQAVRFYQENADRLLMTQTARVVQGLQSATSRVKDDPALLEIVVNLMERAGSASNLPEATELLAHAYVQQGNLRLARDLYQKLIVLEPQNPQHTRNLRQVQAKLVEIDPTAALAEMPRTAEESGGAASIDEIETSDEVIQKYPDDVADAVDSALTDSELFDSYNVIGKAIPPLEKVLPRAPQDVRLNRRLTSLYARNGQLREAAERCKVLETVYSEAGHLADARQFAQLAAKYRTRAGLGPENATPAAIPAAKVEAAPLIESVGATNTVTPERVEHRVAPLAAAASESAPKQSDTAENEAEPGIKEFDLSEEWDQMAEAEPAEAAPITVPGAIPDTQEHKGGSGSVAVGHTIEPDEASESIAEMLEEIRVYIDHEMWREAQAAIARCESIAPGNPELLKLKKGLPAAFARPEVKVEHGLLDNSGGPAGEDRPAIVTQETAPELLGNNGVPVGEKAPGVATVPTSALLQTFEPVEIPDAAENTDLLGGMVSALEDSLGDFELAPPAPQAPASKPATAETLIGEIPTKVEPPAQPIRAAAQEVTPAPSVPPSVESAGAMEGPPQAEEPEEPGALADVFAEFKESMETGDESDEDPDTHYNLGIAFKEMGLMDEAIGELQKVCQAIDRGRPFAQAIQVYTWLANCFLEKGVPEAAIRWYEKALKSGSVDEETASAIQYEVACAYEVAGDKQAALKHFLIVYGTNIDYRDVAERIKVLKS